MDNRDDIRDFLATRRAKLTPADVGLPTSARHRVPGLRREEVAVLAGVSTEWYTKLEKGHIAGVSEEVLAAVGEIELTYQSTEIPLAQRAWHDLTFCTAEPGTVHEERLRLLASWHATGAAQEPDGGASLHPGS